VLLYVPPERELDRQMQRGAGTTPQPNARLSGDQRVWIFTALLTVGALVLATLLVRWAPPAFVYLPLSFWVFVPVFAVAELVVVHVHLGRSTQSLSLSETPMVAGLAFLSPLGLLAARFLGTLYALSVHARVPPVKLGFNLAVGALETTVALTVWHVIMRGADPISPRGWMAAVLAILAMDALSALCFLVVLSLHEGRLQLGELDGLIGSGMQAAFVNASFGVVLTTVLAVDWRAVWALVVVAATLALAYRAHAGLRRSHTEMEQLYDFARTVEESLDAEVVTAALLEQSLQLLRAGSAELRVMAADGSRQHVRLHAGEFHRFEEAATAPLLQKPLLLPAGEAAGTATYAREWGTVRELVAVPLRGEDGGVVAELWVVNRHDDVTTFEPRDLRLLETVANQAAVALENCRLVDELRHHAEMTLYQARHDELTGLPNRGRFQELVREAMAAHVHVAVLLLDLDRFKEVNDTLGHSAGDLLLNLVAERLRSSAPREATVARLGGDEYAVLLPGVADAAAACLSARQVLAAFEPPFEIEGVSLDVGVSIGAVVAAEHGDQPEVLLQRADVAMYQAKENSSGVELYAASRDPYSPRRLAMMNDLRHAIEAHQLTVHYQTKWSLLTGGIRGVEALVRWQHPEHGFIGPDEFIPLAEQTGLIVPLTEFVLRTALGQCRAWHVAGSPIEMAVNVSARSLLDSHFPETVERAVRDARLSADVLTLEITETGILVDSARTKEILERLSGMGVKLSIDDFGTGFSSLARLKDLPVDELKIDRSFVSNMTVNNNDQAIVRSTIDLARNLGLLVVAEGIEDEATMLQLAELGCHLGQGYWFSRPVPAEALAELLGVPATTQTRAGRAD
jgi:diguanylate cyclase (GGDEF)-like protein